MHQVVRSKGGPPGFPLHLCLQVVCLPKGWWLRWQLSHLLVLPPAFIPPPPGSSPSTFLSRNTFCLIGYVLCGREEIPWPPQWAGDPHWANQMLSSYNLNLDQKDKRLTIVAETIAAPLKDCLFSTCCSDPLKCFLFYSPQAWFFHPSFNCLSYPFHWNRSIFDQGFCSFLCLLAAKESSLTPQAVLLRESLKVLYKL